MKLSELIAALSEQLAEHGDVPVYGYGCQDEFTSEIMGVYHTDVFSLSRVVVPRGTMTYEQHAAHVACLLRRQNT